jgi:hypothetical protein
MEPRWRLDLWRVPEIRKFDQLSLGHARRRRLAEHRVVSERGADGGGRRILPDRGRVFAELRPRVDNYGESHIRTPSLADTGVRSSQQLAHRGFPTPILRTIHECKPSLGRGVADLLCFRRSHRH